MECCDTVSPKQRNIMETMCQDQNLQFGIFGINSYLFIYLFILVNYSEFGIWKIKCRPKSRTQSEITGVSFDAKDKKWKLSNLKNK